MASAMNSISLGCNSFFSVESSFISSSSMCKRPAVSTRTTSLAESLASLIAPRTISSGLSVPAPGHSEMPMDLATCDNCSRAAGRYTSVETTMGRCPCCDNHLASLPVVVVLPEPCKPTIIHTEGGREANSGLACLPRRFVNSSRTIFTTCWSGESCSITSEPRALARMLASSSSATPTLTSPSMQRFADFPQRHVQVLFGELSLAAQVLKRSLQLFCQVLKHDSVIPCASISIVQVARLRCSPGAPRYGRNTLDVLQVRILEKSGVFQAEAKHTIEAHVCHPDQS